MAEDSWLRMSRLVRTLRVATALLGLAHTQGWTRHPERMVEWLEQLALDLNAPVDRGSR